MQKFLILRSNLYFYFIACAFDIVSEKLLPNPKSKKFTPMFLKVLVLALKFTLLIHFELLLWIQCEVRVQLYPTFARGNSADGSGTLVENQ